MFKSKLTFKVKPEVYKLSLVIFYKSLVIFAAVSAWFYLRMHCCHYSDWMDVLVHPLISFLYFSGEHTKWNPLKIAKTQSDLAGHLKPVQRGSVVVELIRNLDMKFFGRRKLADAWCSCLLTSCCSRQCDNLSTPSIWCSCGSALLRD